MERIQCKGFANIGKIYHKKPDFRRFFIVFYYFGILWSVYIYGILMKYGFHPSFVKEPFL